MKDGILFLLKIIGMLAIIILICFGIFMLGMFIKKESYLNNIYDRIDRIEEKIDRLHPHDTIYIDVDDMSQTLPNQRTPDNPPVI